MWPGAAGTAARGHPAANAQQQACFAETGHCIGGRFAQYWQQNGGLPVFGYPLTDELTEQGCTVQYFELHTENAAPYDVLLGLLGEEVLQQQGIDWHARRQRAAVRAAPGQIGTMFGQP